MVKPSELENEGGFSASGFRDFKLFCPWLRVEGKKTRDFELENDVSYNTYVIIVNIIVSSSASLS